MIYGENQVRNFHVVKANTTEDPVVKTVYENGTKKIYFKDAHGVFSDKIDVKNIRSIKVATPTPFKLKKWSFKLTTVTPGTDIIVNFDFTNYVGFGENDHYHKFAVAHVAAGDTVATVLEKLYKSINRNFKLERVKPFETLTSSNVSSDTLTIEEADFSVSPYDLLVQNVPYHIDTKINVEIVDRTTSTTTVTPVEVTEAEGISKGNRFMLADMEQFFLKGRANLYGYNGFPNIAPTENKLGFTGVNTGNITNQTDSVIEINYYYQDKGTYSYNSEKQMTLYYDDGTADKANSLLALIKKAIESTDGDDNSGEPDGIID